MRYYQREVAGNVCPSAPPTPGREPDRGSHGAAREDRLFSPVACHLLETAVAGIGLTLVPFLGLLLSSPKPTIGSLSPLGKVSPWANSPFTKARPAAATKGGFLFRNSLTPTFAYVLRYLGYNPGETK